MSTPPFNPAPGLSARNIAFRYRRQDPRVLDEVSVHAAAGSITGIIGPNAAGKTTLLRILLGTLVPETGAVELGGRPISHLSPRDRARRLGYVSQRPTVDMAFRVEEVIALGRYAVGPSPRAVTEAIARCRLDDLADRPYHTLSVGQQQRVGLARALCQLDIGSDSTPGAASPRALLLDEPVSAMDPRHLTDTARILRTVARDDGVIVVIVLHDLPVVARLCDTIWALRDDRLAAAGPVDSTLTVDLLEHLYGTPFDLVVPRPAGEHGDAATPPPGAVPLPALGPD